MGRLAGKFLFIYDIDNSKEKVTRETRNRKKKSRYLALFDIADSSHGWLPRWRLASMVKESLIAILKETSCYVVISLGACETGTTPGALTIVIVTRWVRRGSSGGIAETKPGTCLRRRGKKSRTLHANRGNANDCFLDPP